MAASNVRTPGEALDKSSSAGVNFKVLKRISPNLEKILATSGQAALYAFSAEAREWTTKETEGTFFLIQNQGTPLYQFVILNQKGVNYFEDIGPGFKLEHKSQNGKSFLFYRSKAGEVLGVYFFDSSECPKIATMLVDLLRENGWLEREDTSTRESSSANLRVQEGKERERRGASVDGGAREVPTGNAASNLLETRKAHGKRQSEATPNKPTSGRLPDASPSQPMPTRLKSSNNGSSPFIKSFSQTSTPGNMGKSHSGQMQPVNRTAGLTPVNNSEILEALKGLQTPGDLSSDHQKKKSEELTRPLLGLQQSQNPQGSAANSVLRKGDSSASCPAPLGQQILKPDFFQNILAASKEQESNTSSYDRGAKAGAEKSKIDTVTPVKPPINEQQRLRNLFLSSKSRVPEASEPSGPVMETSARQSETNAAKSSVHESMRLIIRELAESDVFIDAIVQQLTKRKLLADS